MIPGCETARVSDTERSGRLGFNPLRRIAAQASQQHPQSSGQNLSDAHLELITGAAQSRYKRRRFISPRAFRSFVILNVMLLSHENVRPESIENPLLEL